MTSIYDYKANITVTTTPHGDKVVTMNDAIFTSIKNCLYDAAQLAKQEKLDATAEDIMKLWSAFDD